MSTLLYVGAGWDTYPFTQDLNLETVIYVDALPDTPHYTPTQNGWKYSHNKEVFLEAVRVGLVRDTGRRVKGPIPVVEDKHYRFKIGPKDDRTVLHYFINTNDVDMHRDRELVELLRHVDNIWVLGFSPKPVVFDLLPNLKTIYCTRNCLKCRSAAPPHVAVIVMRESEWDSDREEYYADDFDDSEEDGDQDSHDDED